MAYANSYFLPDRTLPNLKLKRRLNLQIIKLNSCFTLYATSDATFDRIFLIKTTSDSSALSSYLVTIFINKSLSYSFNRVSICILYLI